MIRWTKQKVLDRIQAIHRSKGKINSRYIQSHWPGLYGSARKHFGDYGAAVSAAGFDYKKVKDETLKRRQVWNPEKVKAALLKVYRKHKQLSLKFVTQNYPFLASAAVKQFGNFEAAVRAAGIDYDKVRLRNPLRLKSKRQVAQVIQERNRAGLRINSSTVFQEAGSLYHAAMVHFSKPSWQNALRFAGFDPSDVSPLKHWQRRPFLLKEIRKRFESGQPLYSTHMQKNCVGMYRGAAKVFGSWRKAVEAAELNWKDVKKPFPRFWTKAKVIAEIRRLAQERVRLNAKAIQKNHRPLFSTATAMFGGWAQAVDAAGINYLDHSVL